MGPGLFESVYSTCMQYELKQAGLKFLVEEVLPLDYTGVHLDAGLTLDLFVEGLVIVELKCVEALADVHDARILTYMTLADAPAGLLINFNVPVLKQGIKRFLNKHHQVVDHFNPIERGKLIDPDPRK